jgi:hypothetical protein
MMIWEEAERISGTSSMVTLPTVLHRTMLPVVATR